MPQDKEEVKNNDSNTVTTLPIPSPLVVLTEEVIIVLSLASQVCLVITSVGLTL